MTWEMYLVEFTSMCICQNKCHIQRTSRILDICPQRIHIRIRMVESVVYGMDSGATMFKLLVVLLLVLLLSFAVALAQPGNECD